MNKSIACIALMTVVAAAFARVAVAQPEHLPSPHAEVRQTIGLSDVTVSFHRPGVKGREIWGDLVPYGAIWRAGANASASSISANRASCLPGSQRYTPITGTPT